ncbi:MAG: hydroxyacylglutathione hydrolase [Proteobacteria bacterium]|nr:hydroxyacylglutathione hydrolase [Pseudomonadota bacterium]
MPTAQPSLVVQPISAFSDNYIWLLYDASSRQACVVDPGDATPVLAALKELDLNLETILITHHHFDHVGGLEALKKEFSPQVIGPNNPAISGLSDTVGAGDTVSVLGADFEVLEVPGHTLDHIAFYHPGEAPLLFCGDTLFAGGCGRLFEGTPAMMYQSLQSLAALPPSTRVYCAHEYTMANLGFAQAVEPDNKALRQRIAEAEATRARNEPTVPSDIALELATNPFLRCADPELRASLAGQGKLEGKDNTAIFATVRAWKDSF